MLVHWIYKVILILPWPFVNLQFNKMGLYSYCSDTDPVHNYCKKICFVNRKGGDAFQVC
jgi:hypothetical protein